MADPGYGSNCYWTKPVLCAAFTAGILSKSLHHRMYIYLDN